MTEPYSHPDTCSAAQAKFNALKISFAPIVFQATYALLKLGILELLGNQKENGLTAPDIASQLNLSQYGVQVLLDVGLSCRLVWLRDEHYILDKTGYFLLSDSMIQTNLDFVQDVCYQGLFHLIEAIQTGKPAGLKIFGEWETIYPALSSLPEAAQKSWFAFDHYYSDKAFPEVLPIVFSKPAQNLVDIGGNTGKWAKQCVAFNPQVHVTIVDLPEQVAVLDQTLADNKQRDRIHLFATDLLDTTATLPKDADVIWMSQFLDCFSKTEILSILKRVVAVMTPQTRLYILDLFWDRQAYEAAAFSLNCISIYFTCLANGNSRMYHSKDLITLIHEAGLTIDEDIDHLGAGHTLLGCTKQEKSP